MDRGKTFEAEMNRSLKQLWDYHFRIPDTRTMRRAGMPFIKEVPADFTGIKNGFFRLLECKQTKLKNLAYNRITENQEGNLTSVNAAGGIGEIIVNFNNHLRGLKRRDETYILDISQWNSYKENHPERKSIPICFFQQRGKRLTHKKIEGKKCWVNL